MLNQTIEWAEFAASLAVFFASHIIPTRPNMRAALVQRLGPAGYGALYGTASLIILAWVIVAAGRAPFVPLWDMQPWHRWAANIAMPVAILLASFAIAAPNPFSFGGRKTGFDPVHPGIAGISRHPLLLALMIWSAAHALVNGDLAHALIFVPFAAFAALGMLAIDRRNRRNWGQAEWARLSAKTSLIPFSALIQSRWQPHTRPSIPRLIIALALWATLLILHPIVIGVSPYP